VNPIPKVTKALLWAIAIGYLLQFVANDFLLLHFALWPWGNYPLGINPDGTVVSAGFQPWQLVSYAFLHDRSGIGHLLFNALALFQFGPRLERNFGTRRYATYFFACIVGAGLCQLVVTTLMVKAGSYAVHTIGVSGGIFGLLLAYAMYFPHERVMLMIPPIEMKVRTMVIAFGVIELVFGVTGTASGVAHFAHLGGMAFGWLLLRYWQKKPPFSRRPPPRPRMVH